MAKDFSVKFLADNVISSPTLALILSGQINKQDVDLGKEQISNAWKILDPSRKMKNQNVVNFDEELDKIISFTSKEGMKIVVESSDLQSTMEMIRNVESITKKTEPMKEIKKNRDRSAGFFNLPRKRPQHEIVCNIKEAPKKGQKSQKTILEKTGKILRNDKKVKGELVDKAETRAPIVVTSMIVSRVGVDIERDLRAANVTGKMNLNITFVTCQAMLDNLNIL